MHGLLAEACLTSTAARVAEYRDDLDEVTTFAGLLDVAGRIQAQEREQGNIVVLAQLVAGSHHNELLAEATGSAMGLWIDAIRPTVQRLLAASAIGEALDADVLTELVAATFIGIELVGPARGDAVAGGALASLRPLAVALDGLGPVTGRAVRAVLRSAVSQ